MPVMDLPATLRRPSLDDRMREVLAGRGPEGQDLARLASELLFALEIHLTSAPVAGREPAVSSSAATTIVPTLVPNDCDCRCRSPKEHMAKELQGAWGSAADVQAWCIAAYFQIRPHPDRLAIRDEDLKVFEKRVVDRYVYLQPELAAMAESAINPGTTAEAIRRVRQANDRHRQTGAYVPKKEDKPQAARELRAQGDTIAQVAAQLDVSEKSVQNWTRR